MKTIGILIIVLLFFTLTAADCEIGTNPLIFDGATAVFEFNIKTDTTHYSGEAEIDLAEILEDIDADIERISLFDMTLEIDRLRDTAPTVTIAGSIFVDGRMLISMSATQLGTFAAERSVFDPQLTSIAVNASTVEYLHTILNGGFPSFVVGSARGTGSVEEMEFRAQLRLYTQVHTNP
jgi:hypothetical protein